jgi:small-conductance mechanosensitive channel
MRPAVPLQSGVVQEALGRFVTRMVEAIPAILSGIVFLVVAVVVVKVLRVLLHQVLVRSIPEESAVYRGFVETVIVLFLWFGVLLAFLSIVGLEQIAAALGTATGFLALGVSYALSGMLADVVAGVYLLRDPDFMPGDTVTVGDTTGEVRAIELRKTRFAVDGDVVVRANADIEESWTKRVG